MNDSLHIAQIGQGIRKGSTNISQMQLRINAK